jgi:hypothetical protein
MKNKISPSSNAQVWAFGDRQQDSVPVSVLSESSSALAEAIVLLAFLRSL